MSAATVEEAQAALVSAIEVYRHVTDASAIERAAERVAIRIDAMVAAARAEGRRELAEEAAAHLDTAFVHVAFGHSEHASHVDLPLVGYANWIRAIATREPQ